jgi:Domain of unknown function (DUF4335)
MTIQRQYSLPNCTLLLEGFGDGAAPTSDLRPVLSILTNVECFLGQNLTLSGGKELLEGLVTTVTHYTQELLSGVHMPHPPSPDVQLERVNDSQHRLTASDRSGVAKTLDLTTVQLFDLVEAIDQFVADTQTLPAWSLNLAPIPKKFAPKVPGTSQTGPALAGLASLAMAGAALFALPAPQIKVPPDLTYGAAPISSPAPTPSNAPPKPAGDPDLSNSRPITDPQQLGTLRQQLNDTLNDAWKTNPTFKEDLVYRVSVGADGKIIGYRSENPAATTFVNETPLPKLRYIPTGDQQPLKEPSADYRVAFTPDGKIQVKPWSEAVASPTASPSASPSASPTSSPSGAPTESPSASPTASPSASPSAAPSASPTASPSASPLPNGGVINNPDAIKDLQGKLYETLDQNWKTSPSYNQDLQYRVRVNPEGKIVDYEPSNQAARDYANEIPLPQLGKLADPNATDLGPIATYKVVFKPDGKLQINPWDGYVRPGGQ